MHTRRLFFTAALAAFLSHVGLQGADAPPAAAYMQSLAGEWRFKLDRDNTGDNEKWFSQDLSDKIKLPGILQGQGYGNDISSDTPWVLTLGPGWWKIQDKQLVDHFSQPDKTEVPFLSQPAKHYLGLAWYQRDIDIPAGWNNRRVVLFLERAHWESTVYVDDKPFAKNDSLVAPHVTDLGVLTPGKHRLTVRVDNRTITPNDGQHLLDSHAVSDSLGATWNGIVGRIELSATSPVWIDDAQAFPDVAKKLVHLKVKIGNIAGTAGTGVLKVNFDSQEMDSPGAHLANLLSGSMSANVTWDATGGTAELDVPLPYNARSWSEYHPALQHFTLTLKGGAAEDQYPLTFGLRQVSFNGNALLLNGQPINLRTTHDGGEFPLTGYPSMDVASWRKIFKICQDYGLNGMRFHSWCPPEAAFEAADEMGFYLQPECGMWNAFDPGSAMSQRLEDETVRLLKAYGNHPSFILLSPSNEPKGRYTQVTPKWAANWYAKDNRRLYSAGTGWSDPSQVTGGPQYASMPSYGRGQLRNTSGWFGSDYRTALDTVHIPVLAHEVGQWCAYPDFDIIAKFTGFLRPSNYDIFKYIADQHGLLPWNKVFSWSSGRFQVACYKEEIEANLRTPGLAGFQLLDLHDYLGQGTALIGVVDAFWEPKNYVTAAEFRQFSGPVVPLARLTKRVFTSVEPFDVDTEIYNYGDGPIPQAAPSWKILDASGRNVASGSLPGLNLPVGKNTPLGKISTNLSSLASPGAYRLVVSLDGTEFSNSWNFWVYPAAISDKIPDDVTVTDSWSDTRTALSAGKKVLFSPRDADLDPALSPHLARVPVFWNIQMTVRPPQNPTAKFDAMLGLLCDAGSKALAKFPTGMNCDWQWTSIINNVRSVNMNKAPDALRPIVWAIDDWNRNWKLGVIFEARVGDGGENNGRLMVSAINLLNPASPVALQLRRSLLDYMAGNDFNPTAQLSLQQAGDLWVAGNPPAATPAAPRAFDPDLNDGTIPPPARPAPGT